MATKTLRDVMPPEFLECTYDKSLSRKYLDVEVVAEHESRKTRWPGPHKNVHAWYELRNGKAVGWNESPSHGWSFPVIKMPQKGA